ncbi:HpcH/HpaI aldolase/citrate lyase family protein [Janibacter terrae]|uniref:HpcH/HpaI aldolase/citrate lyase family protein n=1 Tax=Janibacter terrae TaxID=103817 RepID=UPI003828F33F
MAASRVAEVAAAQTMLFVPGDRPERFAKAVDSGADVVVVDLEDAVAPEAKEGARAEVVRWFAGGGAGIVRVNAPDTPWFEDDVAALAPHVDVVLLPKAQDPSVVSELVARLRRERPDAGVLALVETAAGVLAAAATAAVPGVVRLAFGNFDLATELGLHPDDRDTLRSLRTQLVVAAAAAGLPAPVDGVSGAIDDAAAIEADTRDALRGGYAAKLCIHPRQVPVVAAALAPSAQEVAWAQRVVEAWESATLGAVALDGKMVDKPVVDRARRVLGAAGRGRP